MQSSEYAERMREQDSKAVQYLHENLVFMKTLSQIRYLLQQVKTEKQRLTFQAMLEEPLDVVKYHAELVQHVHEEPNSLWLNEVAECLVASLLRAIETNEAIGFIVRTVQQNQGFWDAWPMSQQQMWDAFGIPHNRHCYCRPCLAKAKQDGKELMELLRNLP